MPLCLVVITCQAQVIQCDNGNLHIDFAKDTAQVDGSSIDLQKVVHWPSGSEQSETTLFNQEAEVYMSFSHDPFILGKQKIDLDIEYSSEKQKYENYECEFDNQE